MMERSPNFSTDADEPIYYRFAHDFNNPRATSTLHIGDLVMLFEDMDEDGMLERKAVVTGFRPCYRKEGDRPEHIEECVVIEMEWVDGAEWVGGMK